MDAPSLPTPLLQREMQVFDHALRHLLPDHLGEFAVVFQHEIVGTFTTFEAASWAARRRAGLMPALIKRIERPGQADSAAA